MRKLLGAPHDDFPSDEGLGAPPRDLPRDQQPDEASLFFETLDSQVQRPLVPKVEGVRELVLALERKGLEDELGDREAQGEVILLRLWRGREGVLYDCVERGGLDGVVVAIAPTDEQMDRKLSLVVW